MNVNPIAAVVILAGLLASRKAAIYWQLAFCLFGAAAALTLPGGAVITPAVLYLPFTAIRAWFQEHQSQYAKRIPIAGAWLGLAVFCGLLAALFVPRAFEGDISILTFDRSSDSDAPVLMLLHPVSGNITQSGYAIGGLLAFLSIRALLERPGRLEDYRDAVLLLAGLDCLAALLNLGEFHLGFPKVLQYVRNAYALFDAYEGAGGLMRIHGTFPETSAFSSFSLPLFAFCFSLWLHKVRSFLSGSLAALLLLMLMISTSTTAYAGLLLYATSLGFLLTYRGYIRGTVPRIGLLVAAALLGLVLLGSFFVLETDIAQRLQDYFRLTLVDKMDSSSGIERGFWNRQAWSNFVDTYGIGVGLGSARASSFLLVLLSNLGAFGTLFFLAFLRRVTTNSGTVIEPVTEASRQAVIATMSAALVSAAVFDLGLAFYAYAAAASIPVSEAYRMLVRRPQLARSRRVANAT